jgi:hypothetical protein
MTRDRTLESQAITITLETRAMALWEQEKWDRRWMRATWTPARHNRRTVLLELLAIRRMGRRLARAESERADAMSAAKAYRELGYHGAQAAYDEPATPAAAAGPITEAELWGGYGGGDADGGIAGEPPDLNREGEPAFNGAFNRW